MGRGPLHTRALSRPTHHSRGPPNFSLYSTFKGLAGSVADAHHFDADPHPNPACHFDADLDLESTYHFDADPNPDPTFQFDAAGPQHCLLGCYYL
jgi:hypothetical protein